MDVIRNRELTHNRYGRRQDQSQPRRPMPLSVQVCGQQGLTVVGLSGELDVEPAQDLRTLFDMLVEDGQVDVVVDLRLLTFCDSVGLSALIHGYHACHAACGSFRVTGDTGLVNRLLHVSGVRELLVEP
jgi:anti-sigma B factor antagonist